MTLSTPLTLLGAPGSPYTRKMKALLRYRQIPHRMIFQGSAEHASLPHPKVPLLPTFYLPDASGQVEAVTDSTPLIRRFEAAFEGRSVLPPDPVVRFLDLLLEDFGDEWLTKAMFHYRWAYPADIEKARRILPLWSRVNVPDASLEPFSKGIAERQIERLRVVGSNEVTASVIESSYRRVLRLLDAHLQQHPYLMGERPGASDFAFYGQLTALVLFDPTPAAVALEESHRVYAWVEKMEDLSGIEVADDGWLGRDAIPATLRAMLGEVGRVYAPFLLANASAVEAGADQVEGTIDGCRWVQKPFPYQAKCLRWLREAREALVEDDRRALDALLAGTGCEALFA
jgi:glutathione S-transferase